jgi:hypothetical protein
MKICYSALEEAADKEDDDNQAGKSMCERAEY